MNANPWHDTSFLLTIGQSSGKTLRQLLVLVNIFSNQKPRHVLRFFVLNAIFETVEKIVILRAERSAVEKFSFDITKIYFSTGLEE